MRTGFAVAGCNAGLDFEATFPFVVHTRLEVDMAEVRLDDSDCTCCYTCLVSGHAEFAHIVDSSAYLHMQRSELVLALVRPVPLVVLFACSWLRRVVALARRALVTCSFLIEESLVVQMDR